MSKTKTAETPAEASVRAFKEQQAKEAECAAVVAEKEALLDRLRAQQKAGDESVSARDSLEAREELDVARLRLQGQQTNVAKAERSIINDDDSLARLVAPILAAATGLPVTVTCDPRAVAPDSLPYLVVVQTKASMADQIKGSIAGELEIRYLRQGFIHSPVLKTLDVAGICASQQVLGDTDAQMSEALGDGVTLDRQVFRISSAWPELPVIAASKGGTPSHWFARFSSSVAEAIRMSMQPPAALSSKRGVHIPLDKGQGSGDSSAISSATEVKVSAVSIGGDKTSGDGTRTCTVEFDITAVPRRDNVYDRQGIHRNLVRGVTRRQGTYAAGLGRVDTAEVLHGGVEGEGARAGAVVRARFTFVAQVASLKT